MTIRLKINELRAKSNVSKIETFEYQLFWFFFYNFCVFNKNQSANNCWNWFFSRIFDSVWKVNIFKKLFEKSNLLIKHLFDIWSKIKKSFEVSKVKMAINSNFFCASNSFLISNRYLMSWLTHQLTINLKRSLAT